MTEKKKNYKKGAILGVLFYTIGLSYLTNKIRENDINIINEDTQDKKIYSPQNLAILINDDKISFLEYEEDKKTIHLKGISNKNIELIALKNYESVSNFINIGCQKLTGTNVNYDTSYILDKNINYTEQELKEIEDTYQNEKRLSLKK